MNVQRQVTAFRGGSTLIAEFEETCVRCKLEIIAYLEMVDGKLRHELFSSRSIDGASIEELKRLPTVVPLFAPAHRQVAQDRLRLLGINSFLTLVDPTTIMAQSVEVATGTFINAGCTIGSESRIGSSVLINRASSIGHHCRISDYTSIGPGVTLCGEVQLRRGGVVGAGATVLPEIRIGENSVIMGGSTVTRNVPGNTLVGGQPAKIIRSGIRGYADSTVRT